MPPIPTSFLHLPAFPLYLVYEMTTGQCSNKCWLLINARIQSVILGHCARRKIQHIFTTNFMRATKSPQFLRDGYRTTADFERTYIRHWCFTSLR